MPKARILCAPDPLNGVTTFPPSPPSTSCHSRTQVHKLDITRVPLQFCIWGESLRGGVSLPLAYTTPLSKTDRTHPSQPPNPKATKYIRWIKIPTGIKLSPSRVPDSALALKDHPHFLSRKQFYRNRCEKRTKRDPMLAQPRVVLLLVYR